MNLRTDLGPLADLIELAFSDSMDSNGRAAVREMRTMSRMGAGLNVLAGMSELTQGISLGYVWMAGERLVGNVSIYPASWPAHLGKAWIIANVAVHPDYRGRGIATRLMQASLDMIQRRGGPTAILQVDALNSVAQHLYESLGFVREGVWITWRRSAGGRMLTDTDASVFISRRRPSEWRAEYALAQRVRPADQGGVGWLRPLHVGLFRKSLLTQMSDWFSLRGVEQLVIRSQDESAVLASLWVEQGFLASAVQLTLMTHPDYQGWYDDALIGLAVRRFGSRGALTVEHPAGDETTGAVLTRHGFRPQRTLVHMRWDNPGIS